jgi:hypothetical protein
MSKTTPDDLVVAYRSLVRRRGEALEAAKEAPVGSLLAELDRHIAAAAAAVGSAPDPSALAASIASRPGRDWDPATLETLRQHAVEAGSVLRRIAESGPPAEDVETTS